MPAKGSQTKYGTTWDAEPGRPTRFTLVLKHPGALRSMF